VVICIATTGTNCLNRSVPYPLRTIERDSLKYPLARLRGQKGKPNGFWLVSLDCQRAGTPRQAGRTADNPSFYPAGAGSQQIVFVAQALLPVLFPMATRISAQHAVPAWPERPAEGAQMLGMIPPIRRVVIPSESAVLADDEGSAFRVSGCPRLGLRAWGFRGDSNVAPRPLARHTPLLPRLGSGRPQKYRGTVPCTPFALMDSTTVMRSC
jgi:hypothetical protein